MGYLGIFLPKRKVRVQLVQVAREKVLERALGLCATHEAQLKEKLAGIASAEVASHAEHIIPPSLQAYSEQLIEEASQEVCNQLWRRVRLGPRA